MSRRLPLAATIVALVACAWPVAAQLPTYGVGRAPTAEEIKAWDLTIPPDGAGLPPGRGTAVDGKPVFVQRCASCHGETGEDEKYFRLVGGRGTLATDKPIKTVGSYWPYATTLWDYIRRAMPFDHPGTLSPDEIYGVTAYILFLNGIVGEQDVIDQKTLPQVQMPNRHGFIADTRPDIPVKNAPPKKKP